MSNFFDLYHEYVKDSEPPPNYHVWSAIGAISALLGKKCVIPYGTFNVYPQLYIILVGKPGLKKSSAMNVAKRLVRSIEGVKTASDCGSREGLMDEMAKHKVEAGAATYWQSAIFVDEVADLLGGEHLDKSMIQFLTTIWDVSIYREATRKSGQVCIHNPYLTLLGCCPVEWMQMKLKHEIFTGGLSRRTIFVLETKLAKLNSRPPVPDIETWAKLIFEAKRIHEIAGVFTLTKAAWKVFDDFYYDTNSHLDSYPQNLQIYLSSKHMLVLKIAMGLSAAVDSRRIVTDKMIELALLFLSQSERNLPGLFAGIGRNELKGFSIQILDKIKAAGKSGLTKADILKDFYNDLQKAELDEIVAVLDETKQVFIDLTVNGAQGAPTYRAVETAPLPPAEDLMPLARRLEPYAGDPLEAPSTSVPLRHLDPVTEQLLARQEQYRQMTNSGVLMKGTTSQAAGESQTLSVKLWG